MSMNLSVLKRQDDGWKVVFPQEWLVEYFIPNGYDWEAENLEDYRNPDYHPNLELNLSNRNFVYIMRDVLGFHGNSYGGFEVDIDQFINISQKWLRDHLGKPSPAIPNEESLGDQGARLIVCGLREGYENDNIHRMVLIAQEGKRFGGEVVAVY